MHLLHFPGSVEGVLRRNGLLALTLDLLDEVGDVPACQGNVLNTATDDITVRDRDNCDKRSEGSGR